MDDKSTTESDHDLNEPRWAGVKQVMAMSGPIIIASLSYTVMQFADQVMVAQISTDALAASGSAGIWSFTLSTVLLGIIGCVSTFVSQCVGKGDKHLAARYAWQGLYLAIPIGFSALILWPLAHPLFNSMGHTPEVTRLEIIYFQLRSLGYFGMGWMTAMSAFFQAINRSSIPMYIAIVGNALNLVLNYLLIFGKFGFPEWGIAGAAIATVTATYFQCICLQATFMNRHYNSLFGTRNAWKPDIQRIKELIRIGFPSGMTMFLDIANWAIFSSFIVGYFGTEQLAAHNVALSFMHVSFMPAVGLNQGIAPIVGQWIGARDIRRAKLRTYTALKIATGYMLFMGIIFALFGGVLIELIFSKDPQVISLGHKLLILAAIFQAFDATNIVCAGALRGAGDTRWMMWTTMFMAYTVFLPLALLFSFPMGGEAYGAWIAATIFIIVLSFFLFNRFRGERWSNINIFLNESNKSLDMRGENNLELTNNIK